MRAQLRPHVNAPVEDSRLPSGDSAEAVDVRPDGTAVVGFDGGGVSLIAPGGTPTSVDVARGYGAVVR